MSQGELLNFGSLKLLIQTGFFGLPGTTKFRDFLIYDSEDRKNIQKSLNDTKQKQNISNVRWDQLKSMNFNDLTYWIGDFDQHHDKLIDLCDSILA